MSCSLGLTVLLVVSAASPSWRIAAEPSDTAEAALRDAATRDGPGALDALAAVSRQYPESSASGLARLAAGLRLLDSRRYADAVAQLSAPDVSRTLLRDHALYAVGRAQEALGQSQLAARSYLAAAAEPASGVVCPALTRAAALLGRSGQPAAAVAPLEQVVAACPRDVPDALLALGEAQLARGDRSAAAAAFDRLDREHPASPQANAARLRLRALADVLPAPTPEDHAQRQLGAGLALLAAGRGGGVPAGSGTGPPQRHARRLRAGRQQPSRDAMGRGSPVGARQPLSEGRPRRPGAALVAAPADRVPRGPLRRARRLALRLGGLPSGPLRGRGHHPGERRAA